MSHPESEKWINEYGAKLEHGKAGPIYEKVRNKANELKFLEDRTLVVPWQRSINREGP